MNMEVVVKLSPQYKITCYVQGYLWGSGKGSRSAKSYHGQDLAILKKQIEEEFENGEMNNKQDFETLTGALMEVEISNRIQFENKVYTNREFETFILGNWNDELFHLD